MKDITLTDGQIAEMNAIPWWHRIRLGVDRAGDAVYTPGVVRHGPDGGDWPSARFGLPADLTGRRVLDVGAWDGFFSFEAERRGAAGVLAVDHPQVRGPKWAGLTGTEGFEFARRVLGSGVAYDDLDLEEVQPSAFTKAGFDVVLCYGVLYHVESPLRCVRHLYELTAPGGLCLVETARDPDATLNNYRAWTLLPGQEGDPTNLWYPSAPGLVQAMEHAGLADVEIVHAEKSRVTARGVRPK